MTVVIDLLLAWSHESAADMQLDMARITKRKIVGRRRRGLVGRV
jgi:hypothetical protein